MPQTIQHPTLGAIQFPDEMGDDQIVSAIKKLEGEQSAAPVAPAAAPREVHPIDPAMMAAAARAGGGGFVGGYPISGPQAVRGAVTGARMLGEGVGTAAAQVAAMPAMATPLGPAAPSIAGATAARFLNTIGQGLEYAIYGTPFDKAENEKATLLGGVALYGPEALMSQRLAASGIAAPAQSAVQNAVILGGKLGTAGGLAEAAVETAKTGELPPASQIGIAAAVPFAAGTAGEYLATKGSNMLDRVGQIADSLNMFRKIGVQPTPGMVEPGRFAGLEARRIAAKPSGLEAEQVNRAYGELAQNINNAIPQTMENKTVYDAMRERMTGVIRAKQELDKLGPKVSAAQREADAALIDLDKSRERFFDDVSKANQNALDQVSEAALENARKAALVRAQGGTNPMSGAAARTAIVDNVVKPMDNAYTTHWERLYSMFPDKEKVFDTSGILKQAESIYGNYNLKVPVELQSILRAGAEQEGESGMASLAGLRNLRELLLKKGKISDADPTAMQGDLRRLGGFITEQLDEQAPKVFGEEGAAQFKAIQSDYKRYSDLWHKPGVEMLYAQNPTDDVVTKIVNGIKENGSDADEYKNLRNLIANLAEPQAASKDYLAEQYVVPSGKSKINPELAGRLASHVNDVIRSNIFWQSSKNGRVDPTSLVGTLEKIGRDPEALRLLNFGTQDDVAALSKLFKDNPRASSLTPQQMSDAFLSVSLKGGQRATPAEILAYPIKASQIENQLVKAVYDTGINRVQSAQKRLDNAKKTAEDLGISSADMERRYNQLKADPLYNFFGDPNKAIPGEGFNQMVKNLFSPAENAMSNADVETIFTHLRNSKTTQDKQLLQNLQRAYLQDHIMSYAAAGSEAQAGKRVSVTRMSELLAPEGTVSPRSELARMSAVLEPEQIEAVRKSLKAADMLRSYERLGAGEEVRKKGMPEPVRLVRRGFDAIGDMILNRDYDRAVTAILNPDQYSKALAVKGEWLKAAGEPIKAVAPVISRFLPQQQQMPQNIQQFAQPQPAR